MSTPRDRHATAPGDPVNDGYALLRQVYGDEVIALAYLRPGFTIANDGYAPRIAC